MSTRAERRRKERICKKHKKQLEVKAKEFVEKNNEMKLIDLTIKSTTNILYAFLAETLNEQYGFGEKRINVVIDEINKKFDDFEEGKYTINDKVKEIQDKYNFKIYKTI